MKHSFLQGAVYQAVPGFEDHLEWELNSLPPDARENWGALSFRGGPPQTVFWTANTWLEPFRLEFDSISEAAAALREGQRNWAPFPQSHFRRSALIAEKLPPLSHKKHEFPWLLPEAPMGAFSLLDDHNLIASARCTSPFPGGRVDFVEDKEGPPSRAYLKLWEALVRARRWPVPGETCLDAGASPGGWSWALAKLGAEVIAVDRAPLESRILENPLVRYIKHDAFTLKPGDIGPVDWLFCDVICYPRRLYNWIETWLASGLARNFVCTIKTQGEISDGAEGIAVAGAFAKIPGSMVLHLYHNKHELTWIKIAD
jgi:23S rRNA (cytidine2498-2'-O)-methyltransferase